MWKQDWDTVRVEYKIDSTRPDIALLQNDEVIGAIEIFVTHAVGQQKAQRLQTLSIDWIEIEGHAAIYEEPNAWTATTALNPHKQYPPSPTWICSKCQKSRKFEEYKRNHPIEIFCARIIDLYFHSGKKYRHVFYVKYAFSYGKKTKIWIENRNREIIASEKAPITKDSEQRLNAVFKLKIKELKQKAAIVDDKMNWTRWLSGKKFMPYDLDNFPFRYVWNEKKKKWGFQSQLKWKKLR